MTTGSLMATMRFVAAGAAVFLCGLAFGGRWDPVEESLLQEIQGDRVSRGLAGLDRRRRLDVAAQHRAREMASRPQGERLNLATTIEETLRESGVDRFHRARTHVDLQKQTTSRQADGQESETWYNDPDRAAQGILQRWRGYTSAWEDVVDPEMDAIGLGIVEANDGWLILVAILLEDQELPDDLARVEMQVMQAVNGVREENGLPALLPEPHLAGVARAHSRDMAERGYFKHLSPEGRDTAERALRAGIRYRRIGENIAFNLGAKRPVETAMEGWMGSKGHRDTILERRYTHTGVGVALSEEGGLYFTQVFLLPPG